MDAHLPRGTTLFAGFVRVHFDGACQPARGGGIATYGFTVEGEGLVHEEFGLAVPPGSSRATNNVAEYSAAIRALEWLYGRGYCGPVLLMGDSQLIIRQMLGEYGVRADHLKEYAEHLRSLAGWFEKVHFLWVPREENQRADALSKLALEKAAAEGQIRRLEVPERFFGPGRPEDE